MEREKETVDPNATAPVGEGRELCRARPCAAEATNSQGGHDLPLGPKVLQSINPDLCNYFFKIPTKWVLF